VKEFFIYKSSFLFARKRKEAKENASRNVRFTLTARDKRRASLRAFLFILLLGILFSRYF